MSNLATYRVTFRITETYSLDVEAPTPQQAMAAVHNKLEQGPLRIEGSKLAQTEYSVPRCTYVKSKADRIGRSRPTAV